jgi:polyhydroxyalkanoate synthesis regulator phasin
MLFLPKFAYSKVILRFGLKPVLGIPLISWKYSLDKINGELELAKKKKQVLDKLFRDGKVSQPTYDSFSDEIAGAIAEIETKQKTLAGKMKAKISELEQQIKTLEFLLVNSEIRHVSGETEEEAYDRECNMLSLGLETTRRELDEIKEAITNLSGQNTDSVTTPTLEAEEEAESVTVEPEQRLEIVMDTETTTSIETAVEEQSTVKEPAEVPIEEASEKEEETLEPSIEVVDESFRNEESPSTEEAAASETSVEEETTQDQD